MKDYLSQYLTMRAGSSVKNTKGNELTELTKPDLSAELEGSVSFVSDQPLEYRGIDEDVAWRVEAMSPQIPTSGPIPFLIARAQIDSGAGKCSRCGDDLGEAVGYTCGPCSRAANLALERVLTKG
jgi:hypothetical protein